AYAPMTVTLTLEDEIDVSRGDLLSQVNNAPRLATNLEAMLVWMHETPMRIGGSYLLKHTTNQTAATITAVRYRTNVSTMRKESSPTLGLNEIGRVELETTRPL